MIFIQKKLKIKKRKGKEDNKSSDSDANDESGSGDESDDQINKYRALLLGIDNKVRHLFHKYFFLHNVPMLKIWRRKD